MNDEINKNRQTLVTMLSIVEDITRTNNQVYQKLRNLLGNPEGVTDVNKNIVALSSKIDLLQQQTLRSPLNDNEVTYVPTIKDISLKIDKDYETTAVVSPVLPPDTKQPVQKASPVNNPFDGAPNWNNLPKEVQEKIKLNHAQAQILKANTANEPVYDIDGSLPLDRERPEVSEDSIGTNRLPLPRARMEEALDTVKEKLEDDLEQKLHDKVDAKLEKIADEIVKKPRKKTTKKTKRPPKNMGSFKGLDEKKKPDNTKK